MIQIENIFENKCLIIKDVWIILFYNSTIGLAVYAVASFVGLNSKHENYYFRFINQIMFVKPSVTQG